MEVMEWELVRGHADVGGEVDDRLGVGVHQLLHRPETQVLPEVDPRKELVVPNPFHLF